MPAIGVLNNPGGSVIANGSSFSELQDRANSDPFVAENAVTAEIIENEAKNADDRRGCLSPGEKT